MVVIANALAMLFESDPFETSSAGNGNGSVHPFSRGKNGVGCIDACCSSKKLSIATLPSKKVVSNPNLID